MPGAMNDFVPDAEFLDSELEIEMVLRPHTRAPKFRALTTLLATAAIAPSAFSQEPDNDPAERPEVQLEISVTAAIPELAPSESVSARDLAEAGDADLASALRLAPGLDAARRGSINFDPTVRGLQETEVAVLLDGSRTFAAGPARMDSDLSHVTPHAIESVEIVKGPYALTWGAGAMSAVDARTSRPEIGGARLGGRVVLGYEDNAEASDVFGSLYGSTELLAWNVLVNDRRGNDYEAGDGSVVPGDYESQDFRGGLEIRLGESATLDYSGGYQGQDDIDFPGRLLDATHFKTRQHSARYQWAGDGFVSSLVGQIYATNKDHLMNNDEKPTGRDMPGRVPPFALDIDLPTQSDTFGGRFWIDAEAGDWGLRLGIDHYSLEQNARRFVQRRSNGFLIFEDIVWPDAELQDSGVFVQGIYRGRDRLEIGAAARFDLVSADAGEVSDFYRANVVGDLDQDEVNVSLATSARLSLSDQWLLTGGVGSVVRAANVLERYSDRFPSTKFQIAAEFVGNPEIDPERSTELNLGVEYFTSSLQWGFSLFTRDIDDYITVAVDPDLPKRLPLSPPTVFRYVNGDASFWGGELWLEHQPSDWVTWRAQLETLRGDDDTLTEPLLGMSPDRLSLALRGHTRDHRLWGELSFQVIDDMDRVATSRLELPTEGAELVDLRGAYSFETGFEVLLAVENLTDEAYTRHLNSINPFSRQRILEEGRTVRLTLSYRR